MLLAIAIANQGRDTADSLYVDPQAPAAGLDTCAKGGSRQARKAIVAFACSLNAPLINRGAALGQVPIKRLIDGFGFAMPPAAAHRAVRRRRRPSCWDRSPARRDAFNSCRASSWRR